MHIDIHSIPQVALSFMNRDHTEFVELRAALMVGLRKSECVDLAQLLAGFLEHTRAHFAEEERQMTLAEFPAFSVHKEEHDTVLADMAHRIAQWHADRNNVLLLEWIDKPVGDWFMNHVRTMDFVTAEFVQASLNQ